MHDLDVEAVEPSRADARRRVSTELLVVGVLTLAATALNLTKAFHIDDAAHLIIAQHLQEQPLHPMSGLLNWTSTAQPIHDANQPPLLFFLVAALEAIGGTSEVWLHLLTALFTLVAVWSTYRLMARLTAAHPALPTAVIVLSPAFLVNQNLMVDIPVYAMVVTSFLLLLSGPRTRSRLAASFALLSAGVLMKYTTLAVLPAAWWTIRSAGRRAWWGVLPVVALVAWSAWNLWDYGGVHLLERDIGEGGGLLDGVSGFVNAMAGYCAPIAALLILCSARARSLAILWVVGAAAFVMRWLLEDPEFLGPLLLVNGVLVGAVLPVVGAVVLRCRWVVHDLRLRRTRAALDERGDDITLLLWASGIAAFAILFAPFQASRHALLAAPPVFVLASRGVGWELPTRARRRVVAAVVVLTAGYGLVVGLADRAFAAFYRESAVTAYGTAQAAAGPGGVVWSRGHWGWQWYSAQAGMRTYETGVSLLRPGDIVVSAPGIDTQPLAPGVGLVHVSSVNEPWGAVSSLDTLPLYQNGDTPTPVLGRNRGREVSVDRVTSVPSP